MSTTEDELLYKDEHINCFLYDNCNIPIITHIDIAKGEIFQVNEDHNQVLFLLKGEVNFLYGHNYNVLEAGTFILLPRRFKYTMNVEKNSSIVIVNVHYKINFCDQFSLVMLHQLNKDLKNNHSVIHPLKINKLISIYLTNIITTISAGLKCKYFHEIKQRELFYYLRAYYSKTDLIAFFAPILNDDTNFVELIYQNYESAKSIIDLASVTNYSISGFKKRFAKVFGVTPHHWIEKEKAKKIHYDINCTQKTFKEISSKYNFYSPSHFNRFCKKMYGMPPAMLRKHSICSILSDEQSKIIPPLINNLSVS